MAKKDEHGRGHSVGNTDDTKRGRGISRQQGDGPRGQNPRTLDQVKRRDLAKQDKQNGK